MRKSLVLAALVMLLIISLPALTSNKALEMGTVGISFTAHAGKTLPSGKWCECGTQDCICDPGEVPCSSCPNQSLAAQPASGSEPEPAGVDTGASLTVLVAALLLVLRLRQM
jgi:hypothetical protein